MLEVIAITLIYRGGEYQRVVILGTSNRFVAYFLDLRSELNRYSGLHQKNLDLMRINAMQEKEILQLKALVRKFEIDKSVTSPQFMASNNVSRDSLKFYVGEVIDRVELTKNNYLTINIGKEQGIHPSMGVVSYQGVVGIVIATGQKYSKVLPLINDSFSLSCQVKASGHIGALTWNGIDCYHSSLENLPKHMHYQKGDSIFTSGYSAIFPSGLFVGTIEGATKSRDDNFLSLNIKLATSFDDLKYVYVVEDLNKSARDSLLINSIE